MLDIAIVHNAWRGERGLFRHLLFEREGKRASKSVILVKKKRDSRDRICQRHPARPPFGEPLIAGLIVKGGLSMKNGSWMSQPIWSICPRNHKETEQNRRPILGTEAVRLDASFRSEHL